VAIRQANVHYLAKQTNMEIAYFHLNAVLSICLKAQKQDAQWCFFICLSDFSCYL